MKTLLTIVALVILIVLGTGIWIRSGAYDIAADAPHWALTERLIGELRRHSIASRAATIVVPPLDVPGRIEEGAGHYAAMCTGCHLAPGIEDSELRDGLYPRPPKLAKMHHLDPATAFWVIKHGIKMTAMPAWGATHDDDAIWDMVAFLRKLPDLTPAEYKAMVDAAPPDEDMHGDGGHSHMGGAMPGTATHAAPASNPAGTGVPAPSHDEHSGDDGATGHHHDGDGPSP
ncbi:MAG: cytochrome c [Lysobacterales bacterium]